MDEMEEVRQRFAADVGAYVEDVQMAAEEGRQFARSAEDAKVAMDGVRDKAIEAAAALGIYRDEQGRIRDEAGRFVSEARLQEMGFSGIRDKAIEAAVAVRELRAEESKGGGRGGGGMFSWLGGLFGGGGGGGGGAGGAAGDLAPGLGSLTGIVSMIAVVEAALMVIGPEVGALATGFLAAGLGVGAFAALAIPTFKQVFGAVGDTKKQLAKLPEPVQTMVIEIRNLKSEWNQMTKAIQPQVAGVFGQAIGIIVDQMPKLMPLAESVIPAISQVLAMLDKGLGSPEFAYFLKFMESLAGPVLTAVASGMAGLGERLMMIMELFSKKDVINGVNIAFRLLGFTLSLLQGFIMEGMGAWDLLTQKVLPDTAHWFDIARHAVADFGHNVAAHFDEVRHDVATWGHDVAHVFDDFRHDVAEVGHDVAHYFDDLRHDAAEVGHDVAHAFDVMRHDIAAAVDGALTWVRDHWKIILAWLVAPIGMAVFEIKTHTHQIAQSFDALRHDVAAILGGARHDIAAFADWVPHVIRVAFDTTRHNTAAAVDGLRHDVAAAFDHVRHDTAAAMGWMRHEIAHAFDEARHDVASATATVRHNVAAAWDDVRHETAHLTDNVVAFFERLPGRILRELAALPGEMLHVGENVILGLIHGIESAASQIPGIMRGLASDVASYFTDPLKLFSPSRVFFEHGMNIVLGAVNGIKAYAPQLQAAMRDLGGGVAAGGLPGIAGRAGSGALAGARVNVTVPLTLTPGTQGYNDPRFLQYLQAVVQEAILRYNVNNPGNGLAIAAGGRL